MTGPGTMHIGELAEQTGLSLRTIRHYDEIGLLKPSGRTDGGFRLYTDADLDRLMLIRRMKPLGYSLEQMAELLEALDAHTASVDAVDALARFRRDAQERRARLVEQVAMADEFMEMLTSR
jgi:MerR family copper efflux transcriptional regulator